MDVPTTRFGTLTIDAQQAPIEFPAGLIGLAAERHWLLLADAGHDDLGWLQSLDTPELALAVVDPRRFVPEYVVRVARRDIEPLQLTDAGEAHVLVIAGRGQSGPTLNLRAPLVINLFRRRGAQVVASDEYPLQFPLVEEPALLRQSA